jgi:alpha-D-xyloside xylohydrolase
LNDIFQNDALPATQKKMFDAPPNASARFSTAAAVLAAFTPISKVRTASENKIALLHLEKTKLTPLNFRDQIARAMRTLADSMNGRLSILFWCAAVAIACSSARADPTSVVKVERQTDGVLFTMQPGVMRLQVWSDSVFRVTYCKANELPPLKSLTVIGKPDSIVPWTMREAGDAVFVETSKIHARIDQKTGAVGFFDATDNPILQEADNGKEIGPATRPAADETRVRQSFVLEPDEGIYGLGQHQEGLFNYRGKGVRLLQQNMEIGIPVALSSKGYVLFWDNPAVTDISVGATDPTPAHGRGSPPIEAAGANVVRWSSEAGKAIDYYFCYGPSADAAMKQYRGLSGDAPMMPNWMWGFWQCKERFRSQDELLAIAKEFRDRKIPIDGIIQDWRYWVDGAWGSHAFDKSRYPDPALMFKTLHEMNYHALISVWPKFDLGTNNIKELEAAGAMYDPVIPYVYPPGRGKWYDPFNPAGRALYWKQISSELFSLGVDGWWLDAPEPELSGHWGEFRAFKTAAGSGAEVFNAYPLMHSTGIYQGQRGQTDQQRVVILTRSAYAGQQRNSAISWSGDIDSTWRVFRNQVPAGLNFCASGIPYWNTDIGGFNPINATGRMNPDDPRYRELFTRWFQFGAFCPMFRVHGSAPNNGAGPGKEIWRFGNETSNRLLSFINLRYRLMPYIYSVSWQVTSNGYTMMRPLVMDFSADPRVLSIPDQYLFGPAIMVNPVTTRGATSRELYLPGKAANGAAVEWYDFWTGKQESGGMQITAAAPIDIMPLYVRAGSIVPMGPFVQYTNEKPDAPIELRFYRGADGSFTLYEDDGHTYAYERGAHATIPLIWNQATQTLTIGQRLGEFPEMIKQRTFDIVFVKDNHGSGIAPVDQPDQVVTYSGQPISVKAAD